MIIIHLELVDNGLAAHECHLLEVQGDLSFLDGLLLRLEFPQICMRMPAVYLICVADLLFIDFLRVLFVPQEVDALLVLLRHALDLGV